MNCSQCQSPIPEGYKFCTRCGAPFDAPAQQQPPPNQGYSGQQQYQSYGGYGSIQYSIEHGSAFSLAVIAARTVD